MALKDLWDSDPRSKEELREELRAAELALKAAERARAEWALRFDEAVRRATAEQPIHAERLRQAEDRNAQLQKRLSELDRSVAAVSLRHTDELKRLNASSALQAEHLADAQRRCTELQAKLDQVTALRPSAEEVGARLIALLDRQDTVKGQQGVSVWTCLPELLDQLELERKECGP